MNMFFWFGFGFCSGTYLITATKIKIEVKTGTGNQRRQWKSRRPGIKAVFFLIILYNNWNLYQMHQILRLQYMFKNKCANMWTLWRVKNCVLWNIWRFLDIAFRYGFYKWIQFKTFPCHLFFYANFQIIFLIQELFFSICIQLHLNKIFNKLISLFSREKAIARFCVFKLKTIRVIGDRSQ